MSGSDDGRTLQVIPSVLKEKWYEFARSKLAQDYYLIVHGSRQSANFYKPGVGYQMCSYVIALLLIEHGLVREVRKHFLGTMYEPVQAGSITKSELYSDR